MEDDYLYYLQHDSWFSFTPSESPDFYDLPEEKQATFDMDPKSVQPEQINPWAKDLQPETNPKAPIYTIPARTEPSLAQLIEKNSAEKKAKERAEMDKKILAMSPEVRRACDRLLGMNDDLRVIVPLKYEKPAVVSHQKKTDKRTDKADLFEDEPLPGKKIVLSPNTSVAASPASLEYNKIVKYEIQQDFGKFLRATYLPKTVTGTLDEEHLAAYIKHANTPIPGKNRAATSWTYMGTNDKMRDHITDETVPQDANCSYGQFMANCVDYWKEKRLAGFIDEQTVQDRKIFLNKYGGTLLNMLKHKYLNPNAEVKMNYTMICFSTH